MEHYIVVKKVTLQAKGKEFHKDKIITPDDVGANNIARYLKKGYIKLLGDNTSEQSPAGNQTEAPFYMTAEEYLLPEQVDTLNKTQLVEYAGLIGVAGFKPNIKAPDLKKLINKFIEEAPDDDDEEGEEQSGNEGEPAEQSSNEGELTQE